MSTVFGGIQKADVKTDDGTIKTDTDADQFGGSLETGYVYGLGKMLTLEPSLGISPISTTATFTTGRERRPHTTI